MLCTFLKLFTTQKKFWVNF